jgi:hypothetical protein
MYDDLMKDVQEKMQPAIDVAEVNKKALETLFSLQSEYVTDFVDSSVAQLKALTEVKEAKDAIELQVEYFKNLEVKMTSVAEKELAALTTAKEEISGIVEKSLSEIKEMPYVSDFNKFLAEATEATNAAIAEATENAKAVMTPATEAKAAPAPAKPAAKKAAPKKAPAKKAPAKKAAAPKAAPKAAAKPAAEQKEAPKAAAPKAAPKAAPAKAAAAPKAATAKTSA